MFRSNKSTADKPRLPIWKEGLRDAAFIVAGLGGAAATLTGCAPSERVVATASPSESPQPSPSESQTSPAEQLGQEGEIAHDQLTMLEQKTSIEDMAAMSVEDFAKLDIADRAAYGLHLVQEILDPNTLAWNVGELANDQVSFYNEGGVRSGNAILSAHEEQVKALVGSGLSEDDGRKLKLASVFSAAVNGVIPKNTQVEMEKYAHLTQVDTVQIVPRIVSEENDGKLKESGWLKVKDSAGRDEWMKVINVVSHDGSETKRQTIQFVRVTLTTLDGKDMFWYAEGNAVDGSKVTELATESIR